MAKRMIKRKCLHCGDEFRLDPRSKGRQRYCGKEECRKASHRASSRKYYKRKSKAPAWRAAQNARTRKWRKENSGYWKRKNKKMGKSCHELPALCDTERGGKCSDENALRDMMSFYGTCFQGFVSHVTGAEPDNIVKQMNFFYDKGKGLAVSSF